MRILITGGSGLLALNWACALRDKHEIVLGTHLQRVKLDGIYSTSIDLESPDTFVSYLRDLKPDLVVHTAGMTNVDQCEREPETAYHANVTLAIHVAKATRSTGSKLIHISTDHYCSPGSMLLSEDFDPIPVNVYGKTKRAAEQAVSSENRGAIIIRTNFFGWGHALRSSFSDWIIDGLKTGKQISLFDDIFFTPVLADTLALTAMMLAEADQFGIYHVVGDERLSKYEFACKLADEFSYPHNLLKRSKVKDANLTAIRPRDMSLNNGKICRFLGRGVGTVKTFLEALHEQQKQGRAQELQQAVIEE